ncbi:MAG: HEAT repeat domain-containing protein [Chloroflexi bacterium]|nr:HEAT repeat domain-containing protein [Chloroflexota bacterium]
MPDRSPRLGGENDQAHSGLEPGLGGVRRPKPDPVLLMALLDDSSPAWRDALVTITDRGLGRIYALELVKIIAAGDRTTRHREGYEAAQRIAATRALEALGSEVAVGALVEALGDRQWWVGQYAVQALIAVGGPALDELASALDNPDPIVRRRIADVLGGIRDRRMTTVLMDVLANDDSGWVRTRAARALGLLRDRRAAETLREASQSDPEQSVRSEARAALSLMGLETHGPT